MWFINAVKWQLRFHFRSDKLQRFILKVTEEISLRLF